MEQELAELASSFKAHFTKDEENQAENIMQFGSIHDRLDKVATKEDIAQVLSFMKRINTGEAIIRWSWNNMAKIGSIGLALIFLWGVFKFGFVLALAHFFRLINGN